MRSTSLDTFCAIVVPDGCPQIAVCQQVTRNPNLLRRCDSPGRRCSVAGVMRSNPNAQACCRIPGQHRTNRRIRQCASFCAHPKSLASWAAQYPRPHMGEVRRKLLVQDFRNRKVNVCSRLGFFWWDDNGPLAIFLDHIAPDFEGSEILVPQRNVGEQCDHQSVPVAYGIGVSNLIGSCPSILLSSISSTPRSISCTLVMTGLVELRRGATE